MSPNALISSRLYTEPVGLLGELRMKQARARRDGGAQLFGRDFEFRFVGWSQGMTGVASARCTISG